MRKTGYGEQLFFSNSIIFGMITDSYPPNNPILYISVITIDLNYGAKKGEAPVACILVIVNKKNIATL